MILSEQKVRWIVIALCALTAVRVFVFAAAFPFFNNVDEQAHVDLVVKYSHARPPHGIEPFASESANYFAIYSTPEYFVKPEEYGGEYPAPVWQLPAEEQQKILSDAGPRWESRADHESGEPPLYYVLAGAWMNLGRAIGLNGLSILYWVRFLNIVIATAAVWVGFLAARAIFPANYFLHLALPMLLAFWPQSAFYSIQGDTLMPLSFGIAFLGLTKLLQSDQLRITTAVWTGLAVAATCLIKTSNLPLPLIVIGALVAKFLASRKTGSARSAVSNLGLLFVSCAVPIGAWFAWNYHYFGDVTATKPKIELLGWTQKPFSEWWSNPLFTLHGLGEFWPGLIASFWRGEFVWHLERMASPFADSFYAIATALAILIALGLLWARRTGERTQQLILWTALLSFLSIVAFLILLSISLDFDNCPYPSRQHPYFTSGRLLNAAAVPFFLLFACAIDWIGNSVKRKWFRWALIGAIALVLIVSQLQVNAPAFASRYNFFHQSSR